MRDIMLMTDELECKKCHELAILDDLGLCEKCSKEEYKETKVDTTQLRYINKCVSCNREMPIYAHNKCNACYNKEYAGVKDKCEFCDCDKIYALSLSKGVTTCANCKLGIRWGLIEFSE